MEEATTFDEQTAENSASGRKAVSEYIRRIDAEREHITRNQSEIDLMQAETRLILERLRVALPAA